MVLRFTKLLTFETAFSFALPLRLSVNYCGSFIKNFIVLREI